MRSIRWTAALALFLFLLGGERPARADDDASARLERLERALEAQQEEIRRLRGQVAADAARAPAPLRAAPDVAPATQQPVSRATAAPPAPPAPAEPTGPLALGAKRSVSDAEFDTTAKSVLGTTAARRGYRGSLGGVQLGGYTTLEFVANSEKDSYFDLHRFVLQINAPIAERIGLAGEIEFEHGGTGADYLEGGQVKIEYVDVLFQLCDAFIP